MLGRKLFKDIDIDINQISEKISPEDDFIATHGFEFLFTSNKTITTRVPSKVQSYSSVKIQAFGKG